MAVCVCVLVFLREIKGVCVSMCMCIDAMCVFLSLCVFAIVYMGMIVCVILRRLVLGRFYLLL